MTDAPKSSDEYRVAPPVSRRRKIVVLIIPIVIGWVVLPLLIYCFPEWFSIMRELELHRVKRFDAWFLSIVVSVLVLVKVIDVINARYIRNVILEYILAFFVVFGYGSLALYFTFMLCLVLVRDVFV